MAQCIGCREYTVDIATINNIRCLVAIGISEHGIRIAASRVVERRGGTCGILDRDHLIDIIVAKRRHPSSRIGDGSQVRFHLKAASGSILVGEGCSTIISVGHTQKLVVVIIAILDLAARWIGNRGNLAGRAMGPGTREADTRPVSAPLVPGNFITCPNSF